MKRLFPFALLLVAATPALAADANGYTAKYECRAGGQYCNVDVDGLAALPCDQTIAAGDAWATINWSNRVICLAPGDHTAKGTLTLKSSGTSGARKVLRYTRSGDNNDDPWNQAGGNRAKISGIDPNGNDYWLIHRLSVVHIEFSAGANNNIVNRILSEYPGNGSDVHFLFENSANDVLQNSVIRDSKMTVGVSSYAVEIGNSADNTYVVNNEIYDIRGHTIQLWATPTTSANVVFENNDIYANPTEQTNGGATATHEMSLSIKSAGTQAGPHRIIHNRMWGSRRSDTNLCCDGGGEDGPLINIQSGEDDAKWNLLQDNIFLESQKAVNFYPPGNNRSSVIGNLFYKIKKYNTGVGSGPIDPESATDSSEFYLNTIIGSDSDWIGRGMTNGDIRCNVAISSAATSGSSGSGTQMDSDAYYAMTDGGEAHIVSNAVATRANSTIYKLYAVIRTTDTPPANGTAGDFLYLVTTTGTSAGSAPSYCTTLGCTTTDGTMVVKAIRGPYTFYRKLRTSPERYTIPYARAYVNTAKPAESAPEANACPGDFAKRPGVGINDVY